MHKPAVNPRPMGGFNTGFGNFNEHLDENAMQAASAQKGLQQQAGSTAHTPPPVAQNQPGAAPTPPREIGTIKDELITRPAHDINKELTAFFDINALLNINPEQDSPEVQARKKAQHSRWQNLNQEQQQLAQKMFNQEMAVKKKERQEEEIAKQQAQQNKQPLVVPGGTQKGPVGPGMSKKAAASNKLQHDRQTLGGPKSAN